MAQNKLGLQVISRYVPGLNGFLKFPKLKGFWNKSLINMTYMLWEQCYYGHDNEGAMKLLQALTSMESIDFKDLRRLVSLVFYHNDAKFLLKQLSHKCLSSHYSLVNRCKKDIIFLFSKSFVALNDLDGADEILRFVQSDGKCAKSSELSKLIAASVCIKAIDLSMEILEKQQQTDATPTLPSISDIALDPLKFSVTISYLVSTEAIQRASTTLLAYEYTDDIRRLQKDISRALETALKLDPASIQINALLTGYLWGMGKRKHVKIFIL